MGVPLSASRLEILGSLRYKWDKDVIIFEGRGNLSCNELNNNFSHINVGTTDL